MLFNKFVYTVLLILFCGAVHGNNIPEPQDPKGEKTLEVEKNELKNLSLKKVHTMKVESHRWEDEVLIVDFTSSAQSKNTIAINKPLNMKQEMNRSLSTREGSPEPFDLP